MSEDALSPGHSKSCGECGMCCKVLHISELNKPAGQWCGVFRKGSGCGDYEGRPPACRGFHCLWLTSDKLDAVWRPDKAGFLMYPDRDGKRLNVVVDPGKPASWRREPYYSRLKAMSQRAYDGYELLICIGDRRVVMFPDQDADLGVLNPDHKIVSGYVEKNGAQVPFAMVLSDVEVEGAAGRSGCELELAMSEDRREMARKCAPAGSVIWPGAT